MPFKMMGKSPLMKKLVGNQHRLPENLKAKIKAAPESPTKLVEGFGAIGRALANIKLPKFDPKKFESESEKKARLEKESKNKETGGAFQEQYKKVKNMSPEKKANVQRLTNQLTGKKKTTPESGPITKPKPVKGKSFLSTGSFSAGRGSIKMPSTSGSLKVPPSTSKAGGKAINRGSSFTDEFGTTYTRDVKGRKKADGSVSKTVTNKRDGVNVSQRDVFKGPKVKGKRKSKTVVRTKFDRKGDVRKVVEKTRGDKRKVLTDPEAEKRTEQLKEMRKKRDESPSKLMKNKTPNKMMKKSPTKKMHKGGMKMMKKKSPTMMMKKSPSKKMMKAPMKKMMKKKK